jgi:Uma2 family endonuclease
MAVQGKLYTGDDLWEISHQTGGQKRFSLIRGVIIEMSPTGAVHGLVAAWLLHLIMSFVYEHDLGDVTAAETGYVLFAGPPQTILAPDVGFVAKARRLPPTEKYYPTYPDLAVEVVSPGDKPKEVSDKVELYLQYGTQLVWVVYPDPRLVHVHRPGQATEVLGVDHELDGGMVLPGFKLMVSDVFKRI